MQNSAEVSTSTVSVFIAIDVRSLLLTCRSPSSADLRDSSEKYRALCLWITSNSVPPTTRTIMTMTNVCMMLDGTDAESSANGLVVNIDGAPL